MLKINYVKIKNLLLVLAIGLSGITVFAQSSISVVSFLEMGSILEFYSDKVKLNGNLLEMTGDIRFTTKYMFYPVSIPTSSGVMDAEIGWGTKNDHECIINYFDHSFEQFEMTEVKATSQVKKKPKKKTSK